MACLALRKNRKNRYFGPNFGRPKMCLEGHKSTQKASKYTALHIFRPLLTSSRDFLYNQSKLGSNRAPHRPPPPGHLGKILKKNFFLKTPPNAPQTCFWSMNGIFLFQFSLVYLFFCSHFEKICKNVRFFGMSGT